MSSKDGSQITCIIRGGTVVNAEFSKIMDVFISNDIVVALSEPNADPGLLQAVSCLEIDARGKMVLPGGVDPHCHVGFKSGVFSTLDDYREATTAAIFGGTTTIIDFAIPEGNETPLDAVKRQMERSGDSLCDSALHGCVISWDDSMADQIAEMVDLGVLTIKMFTTYRGESMADDDTILRVMRRLKDLGGMVVIHCESNHLIEEDQRKAEQLNQVSAKWHASTRSELAELSSVRGILDIADAIEAPIYFVHQSTKAAVHLVAAARERGVFSYSEAVLHHLVLDDGRYDEVQPERYVCCPPLRPRSTVDGLVETLLTGLISTLGSDHCCYNIEQKMRHNGDVRTMPNGLPGVETRLTVGLSIIVGQLGLPIERFVAISSTNPAKLHGLFPKKGAIIPGSDADIVIWDLDCSYTLDESDLHMATDYSPYHGMQLAARPIMTMLRGRVVVKDGELADKKSYGHFVPGVKVDYSRFISGL